MSDSKNQIHQNTEAISQDAELNDETLGSVSGGNGTVKAANGGTAPDGSGELYSK